MSEDCIFCRIVDGEIPSRTVHEDENVQALLDANPLSRGHTLVIPKEHFHRVRDLSDDAGDAVFSTLRRLAPRVEDAVDADGVNIGLNDGEVAGQEIPHVHGHIVPRFEGDGGGAIHSIVRSPAELSDDELDEVAESVRDAVDRG